MQLLKKTRLSKTWRIAAAAEAGEIQSNKITKTRKLKNCESQMSYHIAAAKAGENLPLHDWRNSKKLKG